MRTKPVWTALSLLLLGALLPAGCSQTGPDRAPIEGHVTLGGQPLSAGRIIFTPAAPNQGPATSARIVKGQYELPPKSGPIAGKNLVQIESDLNLGFAIDDEQAFAARGGKPLPPSPIPPHYGAKSTQFVEVKKNETNEFDVSIPKARHIVSRPTY